MFAIASPINFNHAGNKTATAAYRVKHNIVDRRQWGRIDSLDNSGPHAVDRHVQVVDEDLVVYPRIPTATVFVSSYIPSGISMIPMQHQDMLPRITYLEKPREYAQVLLDVLQSHRWVYDHYNVLHRNITLDNIRFYTEGNGSGRMRGVLVGYDESESKFTSAPFSTESTPSVTPFTAWDLLSPHWKSGHLYRHDLESLFYSLLVLVCHYDTSASAPTTDCDNRILESAASKTQKHAQLPRIYADYGPFDIWFTGTDEQVWQSKVRLMQIPPTCQPLPPVTSFFQESHSVSGFKRWVRLMKNCFVVGYNESSIHVFDETEWEKDFPQTVLRLLPGLQDSILCDLEGKKVLRFEEETLNGFITYEVFLDVMSQFGGTKLDCTF